MTAIAMGDRRAAAGTTAAARRADDLGAAWLAPAMSPANVRTAMLELTVLMTAAMALCYAAMPGNPLLLELGFPWAWLLPLVLALRYGTLAGIGAALMLLGGWFLFHQIGAQPGAFPRPFFIGGTLLVLLAGQFGDVCASRLARQRSIHRYLDERLAALTKQHYLLRISHARLESDLLARPTTLRDTLAQLRAATAGDAGADDARAQAPAGAAMRGKRLPARPLAAAAPMMQLVAQACQLEAAALFPCDGDRVLPEAAAAAGPGCRLDAGDPLLRRCLQTRQLAHRRADGGDGSDGVHSRYLAVAPVLSGSDRLIGVLVVERMPFLALHHDNLELLLVLLGYYADGVDHASAARAVERVLPDCPPDFAIDYARLARLRREVGIASTVVALAFGADEHSADWFEQAVRSGRAQDLAWARASGPQRVLMTLMPLADTEAASGYLLRIERMLQAQFGIDFEQGRIGIHTLPVPADGDPEPLRRLLQRCEGGAARGMAGSRHDA
ncbi:PelD GGDEF domain-containing protein [Cupriavidus sp. H18C1]|uniref:PelD GGDEF domain-containing protein n=1 Tax=Cupriavidus sp. H18C1 TaxID=3241601 RepID=UPI003BB92E0A